MKRLVTFLGKGDYKETRYVLCDAEERQECETRFVAAALTQFLRPDEVVVLATEASRKQHGEALRGTLEQMGCRSVRLVEYPLGQDEREQWQQYRILMDVLLGGESVPRELYLDITHSFRTHGFLAASALPLVRQLHTAPESIRVFYGAFENRDEGTNRTPVWELTTVLDAFDWAMDIATFMRTGYVGDLGKRAERFGRQIRKAWALSGRQGKEPRLREFAQALDAFAEDLRTLRLGAMLAGDGSVPSSAQRLVRELDNLGQIEVDQLTALRYVLPWLRSRLDALTGGHLFGQNGQRAVAALARFYLDLGRYLEAMITVREGLVLAHMPEDSPPPGQRFDRQFYQELQRFATSKRWYGDHETTDLRNDLVHAGLRPDPRPSRAIAEQVARLVSEFASWTPQGSFANVSNHPIGTWSPEQIAAARQLAPDLYDVPFPRVSETATLGEVQRLADQLVGQLRDDTRCAMVMGEFVLCSLLIPRLQRKNILVVAATTRRIVREENGKQISEFRFCSFRPYPRLELCGAGASED